MKTVYTGKDGYHYYLEIVGKDKEGVSFRKRTNSPRTIERYIQAEGKNFVDAKVKGEDLILYTASGIRFIVKNFYELQQDRIFHKLLQRVEEAPVVSENLLEGKRSTTLQLLGLKILYINRVKLASVALTGVLLVNGIPALAMGLSNLHNHSDFSQEIVLQEKEFDVNHDRKDMITFTGVEEQESWIQSLKDELSLESRLEATARLKEQYNGYDHSKIMLGARVNLEQIQELFSTSKGQIILSVGETYGVDPYLLVAKGLAESNLDHDACIPGGKNYNGYGVGAFQWESPNGEILTAWNFKTGEEDKLALTMENAVDFEKNAQGAAMHLQNRLNLYHGNFYLAFQSYNYGPAMMKLVIHDYAKQKGITEEEVIDNLNDLGWLEIVQDIHENPNNYYYRVMLDPEETDPAVIAEAKANYVWRHGTYGNAHYVSDVLSYYVGIQSQNRNMNGTSFVINLQNNEILILAEAETEETLENRVSM